MKVNCADKPWVDSELLRLDRKRKREYNKRKKSNKWLELNKLFNERAEQLKVAYYKNRVEDLKTPTNLSFSDHSALSTNISYQMLHKSCS